MIKHVITITLTLLVLTMTGCQESQVTSPATFSDMKIATTFDPKAQFPRSANYDFIRIRPEMENLSPEATAIVNRVRDALTKELKAQRYRQEDTIGQIDYLVDYELVAQHNVTVLAERTQTAGGEWISVVGVPDDFIEGSLVVDVIDFDTLRTVWRGLCHVNIALLEVSEEEKQQRVQYAVKKLLETFPPK